MISYSKFVGRADSKQSAGGAKRNYRGLKNPGNWCYLNSVLQSLSSSGAFVAHLKDLYSRYHQRFPGSFSYELLLCLEALRSDDDKNNNIAADPAPLISLLAEANPQFANRNEQDAHELLEVVLDIVSQEGTSMANETSTGMPVGLGQYATGKVASSPVPHIMETKLAGHPPFRGLCASHVRCTGCGTTRVLNHGPFATLSLPVGELSIPQANGSPNLRVMDSLRQYTSEELLDEVECCFCSAQHLSDCLQSVQQQEAGKKEKPEDVVVEYDLELQFVQSCMEYWKRSGLCGQGNYNSWDDQINAEIIERLQSSAEKNPAQRPGLLRCVDTVDELASSVRQTTTKRLLLSRLPACLCLHLNRKTVNMFSGQLVKLENHVEFPKVLDMSPFCCPSTGVSPGTEMKPPIAKRQNGLLYRLKAVVVHLGSAEGGGHYVTYAAAPYSTLDEAGLPVIRSRWVYFSDASTRVVTEEEVLAATAFLLFYERIAAL